MKTMDLVQLRCRDNRALTGIYEPLILPVPGMRTYAEVYQETQTNKNQLIKEFRNAVLSGQEEVK